MGRHTAIIPIPACPSGRIRRRLQRSVTVRSKSESEWMNLRMLSYEPIRINVAIIRAYAQAIALSSQYQYSLNWEWYTNKLPTNKANNTAAFLLHGTSIVKTLVVSYTKCLGSNIKGLTVGIGKRRMAVSTNTSTTTYRYPGPLIQGQSPFSKFSWICVQHAAI